MLKSVAFKIIATPLNFSFEQGSLIRRKRKKQKKNKDRHLHHASVLKLYYYDIITYSYHHQPVSLGL